MPPASTGTFAKRRAALLLVLRVFAKRLGWLFVVLGLSTTLWLLTRDLLRAARDTRDGWRAFVNRAVAASALVVSKRDEVPLEPETGSSSTS